MRTMYQSKRTYLSKKNKGAEGDFQQGEAVYSRATEGSLLYYSKSNIILLLLQYI